MTKEPPIMSSAEKVASIDYILTKIFDCLPLKSLVRFEAVSGHWFSLITDPPFSPLIKPRNASGLFLIPYKHRKEPFTCEVDFLSLNEKNFSGCPLKKLKSVCETKDVNIMHSCNGLILCYSPRANGGDRSYFVYNPTTNQNVALSQPRHRSFRGIRGMYLAYDPSKSPHYKVLCVSRFGGDLLYKIYIYSSLTCEWRVFESEEFFYYSSKAHFDRGVYWNGAVHWLSDTDNWLRFNLDEEKLHIIPSPEEIDNNDMERSFVYFGESGGRMHVVGYYSPPAFLYVYEMDLDCSHWHVKYKVSVDDVASKINPRFSMRDVDFVLLSIVCGEEDEYMFLAVKSPSDSIMQYKRIVQLGLKYESFQFFVDYDLHGDENRVGERVCGWIDAFQYTESLAWV